MVGTPLSPCLESRKKRIIKIINNSYSPYSQFKVAANLLTECGEQFDGVNIENSSYSLTLCAEAAAISAMVSKIGPNAKIKNIIIANDKGTFCPPCGACRQRLSEFSTDDTEVILISISDNRISTHTMSQLLPHKFCSDTLITS